MGSHSRTVFLAVGVALLSLAGQGCAYRLYVVQPTSERVRIIAGTPETYVVHLDTGRLTDYPVPSNGKVELKVPGYRPPCGVYLFNAIKVNRDNDPAKRWPVTLTAGGKTVRRLSVQQLRKLSTDEEGYRLLKVR